MSIVNWRLEPHRALILSDTLATDKAQDAPMGIIPKALVLPHLLSVVAGKGLYAPIAALWSWAMDCAPVRNIDELAQVAQGVLQSAYEPWPGELEEEHGPCTAYLFGWSWRYGRVVGYAFPQETGFAPMPLPDAEAVTPYGEGLPGSRDWGATVAAQQAADRLLTPVDRDNIGGVLTAHQIVAHGQWGAQILVEHLGPLPHFAHDSQTFTPKPAPSPQLRDFAEFDRCAPWLAAALERDDQRHTMADLRKGFAEGRYALFPGERSAALVETVFDDGALMGGGLLLHFYLAGGELAEIRDRLRPRLEGFGRRLGCTRVIITGRRGWARAFAPHGYQLVREFDRRRNWWLVAKPLCERTRRAPSFVAKFADMAPLELAEFTAACGIAPKRKMERTSSSARATR